MLETHQGLIIGECIRAIDQGAPRLIEVEDLVQEAHLLIWQKMDAIREARCKSALIRRIVRSAIGMALRRLRNVPEPMELREAVGP